MATKPQGNALNSRFGPSEWLINVLRSCSKDPTEAIKARLKRMLQMFYLHHCRNGANEVKEMSLKRCYVAAAWYYKILEKLVSQERKRLGVSVISKILDADLIQCCLVACCLEISISSSRLHVDFPLLLHILNVAPYHFWRVIELVLRADAGLHRAAVLHLAQAEDKVLESLAWTSNSPLWEEIRANEGRLPTCQQVMSPAWLENSKKKDLHSDANQPGVDVRAGRSASTSQQHSPSAVNKPKGNSFHLFVRKVYRLMSRRLKELCTTLDISDELRMKVWTCFEHSLVQCTHLMVDRHLDQMLLCAIYITAKITKVEIPFKHIMKCYKSLPHAGKSVCKNVLISGDAENSITENNNNGSHSNSIPTPDSPSTHYPGSPQEQRGNLIYFYNQVYTTKMQHFVKQFAPTCGGDTPPLSPYPLQRRASPQRHQLSSSPNIFISPYEPENLSPTRPTGLRYYFNSSPPERLREMNNMIRTGRSPNRRRYVVSLDEEGEDGPAARRPRLDDQSAFHRRLRNVVNDRATTRR